MKKINSALFGEIDLLEDEDKDLDELGPLILRYPANAFGILNRILNEKGFMMRIDVLPKEN